MHAQQAMGWTVAGVTGIRQIGGDGDAVETVDGLKFFRTQPVSEAIPIVSEINEVRALARTVDSVVAAFCPDVLHAHSPVLGALAALRVGRRHKLPVMYEIRAFWEDAAVGNGTGTDASLKFRATRAIETWAVQRADAVAVICEGLRTDLISRGIDPRKILVSPNGVDMAMFGDPRSRDDLLAAELGLMRKCCSSAEGHAKSHCVRRRPHHRLRRISILPDACRTAMSNDITV